MWKNLGRRLESRTRLRPSKMKNRCQTWKLKRSFQLKFLRCHQSRKMSLSKPLNLRRPRKTRPRPSHQTSVQSRSQLGTSDGGPSMEAAKTYAEMQVVRWEQARPEQVLPPNVEYVWPDSRPDSLPWLTATLATSQYLRSRMTAADRVEAWVAELRLDRRDLAAAQDLTTLEIPVGILEPWECVTILQTLLLEAGFGFVNLIPSWTTTVVSEVAKNLVQGLVGDVQTLLTVEFVEFRYFFWNTLESLFQSCWTCLHANSGLQTTYSA